MDRCSLVFTTIYARARKGGMVDGVAPSIVYDQISLAVG